MVSRVPGCSLLCRGRQDGKAADCNPAHARVRFPPSTPRTRGRSDKEAPVFQTGKAGSTPAACSQGLCREGWARLGFIRQCQVGSIPTPATGSDLFPTSLVAWGDPKGPTSQRSGRSGRKAGESTRPTPKNGRGSRTRWQTAYRTSASRRLSGGTAAARCPSSVDGDAPGPYPGEDRSIRSEGSISR